MKVLIESITSPTISPEKIFEERIILVKTNQPEEIENMIRENFPDDTYQNAEGGWTTHQVAKILDVFELVEDIEEQPIHLKEVYSRFLIFDKETSVEEVVNVYSLDK